jgi:hypothetical protein
MSDDRPVIKILTDSQVRAIARAVRGFARLFFHPMATDQTTLRQKFEIILKGIEQEALEAANTLGFDTESPGLLAAVNRELAFWYNEVNQDPGTSYFLENYTTLPEKWDRAICVEIIMFLIDGLREDFEVNANVFDILDGLENELNVLRRRLVTAKRTAPE